MFWNCSEANGSLASILDIGFERRASQLEERREQTREVLKRLVGVVVVLAKGSSRSFRGRTEKDERAEQGPFLEVANLLKKCDPLLRDHLVSGPKKASSTSNRIKMTSSSHCMQP